MIAKAERNTQVATETLEQRDEQQRRQPRGADAELAALKARIAVARTIKPEPHAVHCRDCFQTGRDAVLRLLDGE